MYYMSFILGVMVGYFISRLIIRFFSAKATLQIDHSIPEKDIYRFDIDKIQDLDDCEYLLLKINHNADLSQE